MSDSQNNIPNGLGLPVAKTFDERLALADSTNTAPVIDSVLAEQRANQYQQAKNLDYATGSVTDAGILSADEMERDARTLPPSTLVSKYGIDTANQLLAGNVRGAQEAMGKSTATRSNWRAAGDTAVGVGAGLLGGAADLISFAALPLGAEAQTNLAKVSEGIHKGAEYLQSDRQLNANERAALQNQAKYRDNAELYKDAPLSRFLADAGGWIGSTIDNPVAAADITAAGVGSMLLPVGAIGIGGKVASKATGITAKTIAEVAEREVVSSLANKSKEELLSVAGTTLASKLANKSADNIRHLVAKETTDTATAVKGLVDTLTDAKKLAKYGNNRELAAMATIMGMEGGGAANQTINQILDMSHTQLMEGSQDYVDLISRGIPPDEAKKLLATEAGTMAAIEHAPLALIMSKMVAKFEAAPLKQGSFGQVGRNMLKETIEEGGQGTSSQYISGSNVQQYADKNYDPMEGLGGAFAEGAFGGMAAAGVMQSPSIARNTAVTGSKLLASGVVNTAKGAASGINSILGSETIDNMRINRANKKEEKEASIDPTSPSNIAKEADDLINTNIDTTLFTEDEVKSYEDTKAIIQEYNDKFDLGTNEDGSTVSIKNIVPTMPDSLAEEFDSRSTGVEQLSTISKALLSKKLSNEDRETLLLQLVDARDRSNDLVQRIRDNTKLTESDKSELKKLSNFTEKMLNNTGYRKAETMLKDQLSKVDISEVTEKDSTEQVESKVNLAAEQVLSSDGSIKDSTVKVLKSAYESKGYDKLSAKAKANLAISRAVLSDYFDSSKDTTDGSKNVRNGIFFKRNPDRDISNPNKEWDSVVGFTKSIVSNIGKGNKEQAKKDFERIGLLTKHMQNKAEALNKNYNKEYDTTRETDDKTYKNVTSFNTLNMKNDDFSSNGKVSINPASAKSIQYAKDVYSDTQKLTDLYYTLSEAFPEYANQVAGIKTTIDAPRVFNETAVDVANKFATTKTVDSTLEPMKSNRVPTDTVIIDTTESSIDGSVEETIEQEVVESKNETPKEKKKKTNKALKDIEKIDNNTEQKEANTVILDDTGKIVDTVIDTNETKRDAVNVEDLTEETIQELNNTTVEESPIIEDKEIVKEEDTISEPAHVAEFFKNLQPVLSLTGLHYNQVAKVFTRSDKIDADGLSTFMDNLFGYVEAYADLGVLPPSLNMADYSTNIQMPILTHLIFKSIPKRNKTRLRKMIEHPSFTGRLYPKLMGSQITNSSHRNAIIQGNLINLNNLSPINFAPKPLEFMQEFGTSMANPAYAKANDAVQEKISRTTDGLYNVASNIAKLAGDRIINDLIKHKGVLNSEGPKIPLNTTTKGKADQMTVRDSLNPDNFKHWKLSPLRRADSRLLNFLERDPNTGTFKVNERQLEYLAIALADGINQKKINDERVQFNDVAIDHTNLINLMNHYDYVSPAYESYLLLTGMRTNPKAGVVATQGTISTSLLDMMNVISDDTDGRTALELDGETLLRKKSLPYLDEESGKERHVTYYTSPYLDKPSEMTSKEFREAKTVNVENYMDSSGVLRSSYSREKVRDTYTATNPASIQGTVTGSDNIKVSKDQLKALEAMQKADMHIDKEFLGFMNTQGIESILDFVLPAYREVINNTNKKGEYSGNERYGQKIVDQSKQYINGLNEINNTNKETDGVYRNKYMLAKDGRFHSIGYAFPDQTNKLFRSATVTGGMNTLDLTDPSSQDFLLYTRSLAQSFGHKIEKEPSFAKSRDNVLALLKGPYADTISSIQEGLSTGEKVDWVSQFNKDSDKAIEEGLSPIDNSNVALAAMFDYARLMNKPESERSNHQTGLTIEIDGVTKGVLDLFVMFGGVISSELAQAFGIFNGMSKDAAMEAFSKATDFYSRIKDDLPAMRETINKNILADTDDRNKSSRERGINSLNLIMKTFLPGIGINNKGEIEFTRNFVKNPITVINYGSGIKGIASKIQEAMFEELNRRMDIAAKENATGNDLYRILLNEPKLSDSMAEAKYNAMVEAIVSSSHRTWKLKDDVWSYFSTLEGKGQEKLDNIVSSEEKLTINLKNALNSPKTFNAEETAFSSIGINSSMAHLVALPIKLSVENEIGTAITSDTQNYMKLISDISSIAKRRFDILMQDKMRERLAANQSLKAGEEYFIKSDGLSKEDYASVIKQLRSEGFDTINLGNQQIDFFSPGYSEESENKARATLSNQTVPITVDSVEDMGVAGLAKTVIGSGDGTMLSIFHARVGAMGLGAHDGVYVGLNHENLAKASQGLNEALMEAWKLNPIKQFRDWMTTNTNKINNVIKTINKADEAEFNSEASKDKRKKELEQRILEWNNNTKIPKPEMDEFIPMPEFTKDSTGFLDVIANNVDETIDTWFSDKNSMIIYNMAGINEPYMHNGQETALTPITEKSSESDIEATEKSIEKSQEESVLPEPNGIGSEYNAFLKSINSKATKEDNKILNHIKNNPLVRDTKIYYDTLSNLNQDHGISLDRSDKGAYSDTDNVIYIVKGTGTNPSTVLAHEMLHSLNTKYIDVALNPDSYKDVLSIDKVKAAQTAIKGIQKIIDSTLPKLSLTTDPNISSFIEQYEGYVKNGDVASSINEFLSWSLTDTATKAEILKMNVSLEDKKSFTKDLDTVNKLKGFGKKVIESIMKWAGITVDKGMKNYIDGIQYYNSVIHNIKADFEPKTPKRNLLKMSNPNSRLNTLIDKLNNFSERSLDSEVNKDQVKKKVLKDTIAKDRYLDAKELVANTVKAGFNLDADQQALMTSLSVALASDTDINSIALQRVSELYTDVTKHISYTNFIPEGVDKTLPENIYKAQEKYEFIMKDSQGEKDSKNRSPALTTFLGLAMVDDSFRRILEELPLTKPSKEKLGFNDIDGSIGSITTYLLDSLYEAQSGVKKNSKSIVDAIDNITYAIEKSSQENKDIVDLASNKYAKAIFSVNNTAQDYLFRVGDWLNEAGTGLTETSTNRIVKSLGAALNISSSAIASADKAKAAVDSLVYHSNLERIPRFVREILSDAVGTTDSNANITRMMKVVKGVTQVTRQANRKDIPTYIDSKFTRSLSDSEQSTLTNSIAGKDLHQLIDTIGLDGLKDVLNSEVELNQRIDEFEDHIRSLDSINAGEILRKSKQLALYMHDGSVSNNLLKNASQIAVLQGSKTKPVSFTVEDVQKLDSLISLYSYNLSSTEQKNTVKELLNSEESGVDFTLNFLRGQNYNEYTKTEDVNNVGYWNRQKGYVPFMSKVGNSLIVANDSMFSELRGMGYERLDTYTGSEYDSTNGSMSYYFMPIQAQGMFHQGIFQNVKDSMFGSSMDTGESINPTAGRITNKDEVTRIYNRMRSDSKSNDFSTEGLIPLYENSDSDIPYAFERTLDRTILNSKSDRENKLSTLLGAWRGRQIEEGMSDTINQETINNVVKQYDPSRQEAFVDILSEEELKKDPVLRDAVNLLTPTTMEMIREASTEEGQFFIRRDMLNDVLGYRMAMISDFWTGNNRFSPKTQKAVKDILSMVFGNTAYVKLMKSQMIVQNLAADARDLIIVRSMSVPMINLATNIIQMMVRGVPISTIIRELPKKLQELEKMHKIQRRLIQLDAEIRTVEKDHIAKTKLLKEQSILNESIKRLTIAPLIEGGEFSSITDTSIDRSDLGFSKGNFLDGLEKAVDKLPAGMRDVGKMLIVSKDSSLYAFLRKTNDYGDFLSKAIMYDHWINKEGVSKEQALRKVTDEFVNYDKLQGRNRHTLENLGLMWFWNWKLRSTRTAFNLIRDNPVTSLFNLGVPMPTMFGSALGTPLQDSAFSRVFGDGSLTNSIGTDMFFKSWNKLPIYNLLVN